MEVVCLILGPMLASQPCLHALHPYIFFHFIEIVFLLLLFPLFFSF